MVKATTPSPSYKRNKNKKYQILVGNIDRD